MGGGTGCMQDRPVFQPYCSVGVGAFAGFFLMRYIERPMLSENVNLLLRFV